MSKVTLIHHFIENSAAKFPDKVALVHENTRATYQQINSDADRIAAYLLKNGISRGDRVIILFENGYKYVISYYGVLKTGAVVVPLSTGLKLPMLNHFLKELNPSAILTSKHFEGTLLESDLNQRNLDHIIINQPQKKWDKIGKNIVSFDEVLSENLVTFKIDINSDDLACIIYTSGSTGTPKGVMLSHTNIIANTNSICQYLKLTHRDIQMIVLPLFYVMGKSLLNTHFAVGGRVVFNNKFAFPASVLNQMVKEKVTGFSGVPSTFAFLLHRSPLLSYKNKLTTLRYCSQAGGHMAITHKKALRKVLPDHTDIVIMYGATEASARLSYLDPSHFEDKMESIGKPIPSVTLNVVNERRLEVPQGEIGELVAKGANIMKGYWQNPEATRNVLDDLGYHTGDYGYKDEEGFFFTSSRKDKLMKVGGHKINPRDVEDALIATETVREASVIGVSDDLLGTKLVALVSPVNGDCSKDSILAKCSKILPKHQLPSMVIIMKSLPKTTSGKIDTQKCLKLANEK